jgi:hypothetical protein
MKTLQSIVAAPAELAGWLWASLRIGWYTGVAFAEGDPLPKQLIRILHPSKLEAIKSLRVAIDGLGLKEAKDICDGIEQGKPFVLPFVVNNPDALKGIFEIKA